MVLLGTGKGLTAEMLKLFQVYIALLFGEKAIFYLLLWFVFFFYLMFVIIFDLSFCVCELHVNICEMALSIHLSCCSREFFAVSSFISNILLTTSVPISCLSF